jgi:hypothetical protein
VTAKSRRAKRRLWRRNTDMSNSWTPSSPRCLETHMFHVKRMHMRGAYGYMLASKHKNYSLNHIKRKVLSKKANLNRGIVVQDISFYGTIELNGSHSTLHDLLSKFLVRILFTSIILLFLSEYLS